MQGMEQAISLYHTGFLICLVLMILSLAVTVILFFKFDIRKVFDFRTGRGAKRTIQKLEEINAKTGKLRQQVMMETPSTLQAEERIIYPITTQTVPSASVPEEESPETEILSIQLPGAFQIKKDVMWIHTNEII